MTGMGVACTRARPGRGGRRCWRRAAPIAVALAAAVAVPAVPAAAAGRVMQPDSVIALPDPGVTLAVPADGRLDGYRFTGEVLGAAVGTASPEPGGPAAAAGERLWVFGLRWQADPTGSDGTPAAVTAVVIAGGARLPVPLVQPAAPAGDSSTASSSPADSGPQYFAASVPAGASDVVVEMASGGFSQDFSLTHMAREGVQPAALYRNPRGWETVAATGGSKDLVTPFSQGSFSLPDAKLTIDLPSVTVSYFGPEGTSQPAPGPDQAWLVPDLQDPYQENGLPTQGLEYTTALTAGQITLTVPGQPPLHPQLLPGGPDTAGGGGGSNGLFTNRYAFVVPADLTSATLTIDTGAQQAIPAFSGAGPTTVQPGTATFPITFPQPAAAVTPPGAAAHPATIAASTTRSGTTHPAAVAGQRPSGFPLLPVLLGVLAALSVSGVGVVLRRRRTTTAAAATATESAGASTDPLFPTGPITDSDGSSTDHPTPAPQSAHVSPVDGNRADPATPAAPGPAPLIDLPDPFVPPAPPELPEPAVRVLGDLRVSGWVEPPQRSAVTVLAVYLASHSDRPVTADRLQAALGADSDTDPETTTVRSNLSRLRRAIGAEHLPEATTSGYQLRDVACDWQIFQQLADQARRSERDGDLTAALELYGPALALVTGRPYTVDSGYEWVHTEGLRTHIQSRIADTALRLAGLALKDRQPDLALWATRQSRLADPLDETVAAAALDAAAATGRPGAARSEWTAITSLLHGHRLEPSPELETHYRNLTYAPQRT